MNILVTNDDGYDAEGIKVLAAELSKKHKVYILAPDGNRSAISHGIIMYRENRIRQISENEWAYSGNPADCVLAALKSDIFNIKFDAVASGINLGANLGTDVVYSGTCAAAREGALNGIPSVAFSLDFNDGKIDYIKPLAEFALKNMEKLAEMAAASREKSFVNVNALSLEKYKGVKITDQLSRRFYDDRIELIPDGNEYRTVFHSGKLESIGGENCDYAAVAEGFISVTSVLADPMPSGVVDGISFSL